MTVIDMSPQALAASRAARGAEWLDLRYPGWLDAIDLDILDLGFAPACMLGQVHASHIPADGHAGLIADLIEREKEAMWPPGLDLTESALRHWRSMTGYVILVSWHDLDITACVALGFSTSFGPVNFLDLTDAWTRLIISRRLAAHPETSNRIDSLIVT